jgi:hypothetical protein
VRTFQYMMFGSAASVVWTVLWIGAVTTCITGESALFEEAILLPDLSDILLQQPQVWPSGIGKGEE